MATSRRLPSSRTLGLESANNISFEVKSNIRNIVAAKPRVAPKANVATVVVMEEIIRLSHLTNYLLLWITAYKTFHKDGATINRITFVSPCEILAPMMLPVLSTVYPKISPTRNTKAMSKAESHPM